MNEIVMVVGMEVIFGVYSMVFILLRLMYLLIF